jgi:hypothetical protein
MRAAFTKFGQLLSANPRIRGRRTVRSTVRQLACEPLAERYVLSATPLAEIAVAEEPLPEMTCSPEYSADPTMNIAFEGTTTSELGIAGDPAMDTASLDAAFAEMTADDVAVTSPEDSNPTEATWTDPDHLLEPTYTVAFDESIASDSILDPTEQGDYWWDSQMIAEGESFDPMTAGTLDSTQTTEMMVVAETDPWDEPLEGEQTGNFDITTFTARSLAGGWMLEGQVKWVGGTPSDLVVHFGGIAEGHTVTVYPDGMFFYYISFPEGWYGSVSATAYDREGFSSTTASVQIWA